MKKKPKPCIVKIHFTCDGTGQMCAICNESETSCQCEESELEKCEGCDGATRFCVEHQSPCGDLNNPPRCDAVK
jgi:hypothetical protein